ncbi:FtsX-like permease family protein [Paenibacillus sp. HW567]|uniref:FtsX-like permease family protein n=1 Tax=Paenibacillus sp. HW567 TaxID=1034769 RepID=UPI00039D120E|nr:FtsX-like permease family protein [Paenibacillus sp. HW567]
MIETNNRKMVYRLSLKSLRANPIRNLAVMCAVILTTLLITSVFTMVMSLNKSMELAQMKTVGTDFHGGFKYLTPAQVEILKKHPSIREYGISLNAGEIINPVFKDSRVEVKRIDSSYAKHGFIQFIAGGLPAAENELVLNTWAMDKLGIKHALGEKVSLDIDTNERVIRQDFVISGFYEADAHLALAGLAFVSDAFVKKNLASIDPVLSKASNSYVNTSELSVMFNNAVDIEQKLNKVLKDTGLDVPYGVNWAYSTSSLSENILSLIPYLAVVFIIMLSGYLLIYNIFYISVVRDVKFYGLLKAIGATPKQLKRMIGIQAQLLYIAALPVGLASGYFIGRLLVPMLSTLSSEPVEPSYSASPWIFAGAAVFSYLTVWIAANKPGRMAARIAPVEAVKFTGLSSGRRIHKRSKRGAKLYSMAFSNLFRNKKKLFLMLTSLSLSIVLFSIIFTVISSLNVNKYLSSFINGDLVINNTAIATRGEREGDPYSLSAEVRSKLSKIDGVESVDNVYYNTDLYPIDANIRAVLEPLTTVPKPDPLIASTIKEDFIWLNLYGIDPGWYDLVQKDVIEGTFDKQKFDSGSYVLITESLVTPEENTVYYHPGDLIQYGSLGKSYEVLAVLKYNALYAATTKSFSANGYNAFFPSSELDRALPSKSKPSMALSATLHVDSSKLDSVAQTVKGLTSATNDLVYKSRADYRDELGGFIRIFQTVGYGLSFVIALIGIVNYINTVLTGVISRRNEFALLESIGMTKRQLKRVLIYEGMYNVLFTAAITSSLGVFLTYNISKSIADNIAFTVFHMGWLPFILVIPLLGIIAFTVTLSSYRMLAKATIVERLRQVE